MSANRRSFTAAELRPDMLYCVIRDFKDYDGVVHLDGERWRFLAKDFYHTRTG